MLGVSMYSYLYVSLGFWYSGLSLREFGDATVRIIACIDSGR